MTPAEALEAVRALGKVCTCDRPAEIIQTEHGPGTRAPGPHTAECVSTRARAALPTLEGAVADGQMAGLCPVHDLGREGARCASCQEPIVSLRSQFAAAGAERDRLRKAVSLYLKEERFKAMTLYEGHPLVKLAAALGPKGPRS